MLPTKTIIDKLQELQWPDGEDLSAIEARLTPEQLEAPGMLILRILERGPFPWMLIARVIQRGTVLFEVMQRISEPITHDEIKAMIENLQALGYATLVVTTRNQ